MKHCADHLRPADLREQFRVGARNVVARCVWFFARQNYYPNYSQNEIADRLQLAHSNITRWNRGEMSFEALVAIMADCGKQWVDLPPRPTNDLLRIGGFARMIGWVRRPSRQDGHSVDESIEHVAITCCLLAMMVRQTRWTKVFVAKKSCQPDGVLENQSLVDETLRHADALLARFLNFSPFQYPHPHHTTPTHQVPFRTAEQLLELGREFGEVWEMLDDSATILEEQTYVS
jgi:hypothetical protein